MSVCELLVFTVAAVFSSLILDSNSLYVGVMAAEFLSQVRSSSTDVARFPASTLLQKAYVRPSNFVGFCRLR